MDNELFMKLYGAYQKELYLYLYSLCRNRHQAEDLLHETFLKALLDQEMLSFIATDAHDMRARAPQMADCAAYLCKKYSSDYARWLLYENPSCILENRKI